MHHDFWLTLSELAIDGFLRPLHEFCRSRGVPLQMEAYGRPPVGLQAFSWVDMPMGEGRNWKELSAARWAASGAHIYGKTVVAAETYTGLLPWTYGRGDAARGIIYPEFCAGRECGPRFVSSLQDMKAASDLYFLSGINHFFAHGYSYSPPSVGWPGWAYYAGVIINDNQPWWPYFPFLSQYINRTSHVLRQGSFVADLAVYLPEHDAMANWPAGELDLFKRTAHEVGPHLVGTIVTNGYAFDAVNDDIIQNRSRIEGGLLQIGNQEYPVILLPDIDGLPVATLERVAEFCQKGGKVVATGSLPTKSWGLLRRTENARRVQALVQEIFGSIPSGATVHRHQFGKGIAVWVHDDQATLAQVLR